MAPSTRTDTKSRRDASVSKAGKGKKKAESVPCDVCGQLCSPGAGLAAHRRAKHRPEVPPAVVTEARVDEPYMPERALPRPPEGLAERPRALWESVVAVYDLRPDELRILEDACRESQLVDRLDRELENAPLMVKGSMGQLVASPIVTEIRQHRATFAALMGKLKLPDDPAEIPTGGAAERATKARMAANARWRRGP